MNRLKSYDEGQLYAGILFIIYLGYALYSLFSMGSVDSFGKGLGLLIFSPIVYFILWLFGLFFAGIIDHYRKIEDEKSQKESRLNENIQERKTTTYVPHNKTYSRPNSSFKNATTYSSTSESKNIGYCRTCGKESQLHHNGECEDCYFDD